MFGWVWPTLVALGGGVFRSLRRRLHAIVLSFTTYQLAASDRKAVRVHMGRGSQGPRFQVTDCFLIYKRRLERRGVLIDSTEKRHTTTRGFEYDVPTLRPNC